MPSRILVVDDDREIVKTASAYLGQSGFQVIPAYDGPSAVNKVRHEKPDLVVLDLMPPRG